jgi:hypothetical protein
MLETTIDVVERYFDRSLEDLTFRSVDRASRADFAVVVTAWLQHQPVQAPSERLRVFMAHDRPLSSAERASALVYADEIAVRDPLDDWLVDQGHSYLAQLSPATFEDARPLWQAIDELRELAPLVRGGAVTLSATEAPYWLDSTSGVLALAKTPPPYLDEVERHGAAAEHDASWRRRPEFTYGIDAFVEATRGWESFSACAHAGARFLPTTELEWQYLALRARLLGEELNGSELRIVPSLVAARVPLFESLSARTILAIRNEDAFESWKAELRTIWRRFEDRVGDADAVQSDLRVELEELVRRIEGQTSGAVSRSQALRQSARGAALKFLFGSVAGHQLGLTPLKSVAAGALTGTGELTASCIWGAKRPKGTVAIVERLLRA